ncbi:Ankyrin repeat [Ekhidna lutea]|uniref:Ankyrin repeat n=1 Tax=Ekhidna lutea TaxID=447679 RepID=A0A239MGB7_EKHLU|nr:ankyrin repeat domain-containing protein [Ekhidna lutea]SNT40998.1 Ankyrin repeat [Ekhidna lutea]
MTKESANSEPLEQSNNVTSNDSITHKKELNKIPIEEQCAALLKEAVLSKDSLRIIQLIDSGCSVNPPDHVTESIYKYPLYWAINTHDVKLVRILLQNGANPAINPKQTLTPIKLATFINIPNEIFDELIKYDVNFNSYSQWDICETPLTCALSADRIDIAKKLVELGATLDPDSTNGYTSSLYAAASYRKWDFFEYLLEAGANPNARFTISTSGDCEPCPEGITVLNTVSRNLEAVKLLFEYGADPNIEDDFGYNLLEQIAIGSKPEIVQYLIDKGANPRGAINNAAAFQNFEVVKVLLENGADPNQSSNQYSSPLNATLSCCGNGINESGLEPRLRVAKLLLEYGAKPDPFTLTLAKRAGNESIKELLVAFGYKDI